MRGRTSDECWEKADLVPGEKGDNGEPSGQRGGHLPELRAGYRAGEQEAHGGNHFPALRRPRNHTEGFFRRRNSLRIGAGRAECRRLSPDPGTAKEVG